MNAWNFDQSEHWWDVVSRSVHFDGACNGKRYVFAISGVALNDYYETADTRDEALSNYKLHIKEIESLAARFASEVKGNDDVPHYFITSKEFRKYM